MLRCFKNQFVTLCLAMACMAMAAQTVTSPDGLIQVNFSLTASGQPTYAVTYKQGPVVLPSHLGFDLANAEDLLEGFVLKGQETSTFDETWQPVWGEYKNIRNHYNELLVRLAQPKTERLMNIRFRVYDDGVGLRYEFPQEGKLNYDSLMHFLDAYNKDKKYDLILTKQGDNILYAAKRFDITNDVINGLNKRYKSTLKGAETKKDEKKK